MISSPAFLAGGFKNAQLFQKVQTVWEGKWQPVGPVVPGVKLVNNGLLGFYQYRQYYKQRYFILLEFSDVLDCGFYRWAIGMISGYADGTKAWEAAPTVSGTLAIAIPIGYGKTVSLTLAQMVVFAAPPTWSNKPAAPTAGITGLEPLEGIIKREFSSNFSAGTLSKKAKSTLPATPPPVPAFP